MKWANLLKVALVAFIPILVISNCKKEDDFAKLFVGNYRGVTYEYNGAYDTSGLLSSYPNSTAAITKTDSKTVVVNVIADTLRLDCSCTVNSSTLFSWSFFPTAGPRFFYMGYISKNGIIKGDSLTYSYYADGIYGNSHLLEFKGVRY